MSLVLLVIALLTRPASQDSLPHGRVETRTVYSRALGVTKAISVYLPPSYATSSRRYPVIYYLHGGFGDERSWLDRMRLGHVADSVLQGGLPEVILAMPDGDTGYWTDWAMPDGSFEPCQQDTTRGEPAASYCVRHGRYESYVVDDVVAFVDRSYRTIAAPEHRGIAGFSMGGYGAFWLAARHPDVWGAAVSHSGVLSPLYVGPHPFAGHPRYAAETGEILDQWPAWRRPLFIREFGADTSGWWARDPLRQLLRLMARPERLPDLYFDVGSADRFADQNRALADTLAKLGVAHEFHEWPGGHDDPYWKAHEAEGLAWLLQRVGNASN